MNPESIGMYKNRGIISNPNCSTIQMVVALKPIHDAVRIKRIVVSTYQAVSGTGKKAIEELLEQTRALMSNRDPEIKVYAHRIAFNCLPHIDVFLDNGYTKEEMKMTNETKKIMEDDSIAVTATCVRVPTMGGHSESVNIEFENDFDLDEVRKLLSSFPGLVLQDDVQHFQYPMPLTASLFRCHRTESTSRARAPPGRARGLLHSLQRDCGDMSTFRAREAHHVK